MLIIEDINLFFNPAGRLIRWIDWKSISRSNKTQKSSMEPNQLDWGDAIA